MITNFRNYVAINPCDSSPCANGGSCTPGMMGPFDYTCQCAAGYTGPRCGVNIDDCQSAVCPNNSICMDGVNSYECICYPNLELDAGGRCVSTLPMGNQGKSVEWQCETVLVALSFNWAYHDNASIRILIINIASAHGLCKLWIIWSHFEDKKLIYNVLA